MAPITMPIATHSEIPGQTLEQDVVDSLERAFGSSWGDLRAPEPRSIADAQALALYQARVASEMAYCIRRLAAEVDRLQHRK
jgi:hypothetical protein